MRNFGVWSIVAVAVLAVFGLALIPPEDSLKLGKDLRGGVTLVYAVQFERGVAESEQGAALDRTIQVLKERVDPQGLFEIQMVAQGSDRIEVSMPLPTPEVLDARAEFDAALAAAADHALSAEEFDRLVRMPEDERRAAFDRAAGDDPERRAQLEAAAEAFAEAFAEAEAARKVYEDAVTSGAPDGVLDSLAGQVAQAELAYEAARDEAAGSRFDPQSLRSALEASDRPRRLRNDEGEMIELPSERERLLNEIREDHPELEAQIDAVIAAYEAYAGVRTSLDDTGDLKRRLSGAGVLSFRISVDPLGAGGSATVANEAELRESFRRSGPAGDQDPDVVWIELSDVYNVMRLESTGDVERFFADPAGFGRSRGYVVEEFRGRFYMLCFDSRGMRLTRAEGDWGLSRASRTQDDLGKPAIGFDMNARGALRLGELTENNVGNSMAVILDDRVYTAPNIGERLSNSVRITGDFSLQQINDIIRTLNAGSLQARLGAEPLSEITIAPELGTDNLKSGLRAGLIALAIVSVFMALYYFGYGLVAVISLAANAVCILGAMALAGASFTLPGIAGVILTFGMAVDANVLIYERVREELRAGQDLRVAVKLGFEKALSSIVDGNVTNLIVCVVLAYTGTQEIKGFAITLGIGVISTMFSALIISRVIFSLLVDRVRIRRMPMLPMVIPAVEKILEPKINWLSIRFVCVFISLAAVGLGVGMVVIRGEKMLDTEFRGGTQVDFILKRSVEGDANSPRVTLTRGDVQDRVHAIAEGLPEGDPLLPLRNADVLALEPEADGVTSDQFRVKTYATATGDVLDAIVRSFEEIDAQPALTFTGSDAPGRENGAPIYPVTDPSLRESVGGSYTGSLDVSPYLGGVAIVLDDLTVPGTDGRPTLRQLRDRLAQVRGGQAYSATLGRPREIRVLAGTDDAVRSAVVLVADPSFNYLNSPDEWRTRLAAQEWEITREALTKATIRASVQSFSPVIARDFQAQAVVAVVLSFLLILIYIWVRFGSVRYSLAAIVTLLHDVLAVLGLIALAELIFDWHVAEGFARALLIEPFKIDLNLVAAILTIIGYSLNDTIIIMDRIRENRGKLPYASKRVVNLSINQTVSRTVITSGTTLLAVLILYIYGGDGVHAFSYALLVGVLVGTYSSIAVASPLVWSRRKDMSEGK